jgi:mono/diheme cytochrome c family protein
VSRAWRLLITGWMIKNGKEGAMPAFGQMFSDADIDAIINYIHSLKPEDQG